MLQPYARGGSRCRNQYQGNTPITAIQFNRRLERLGRLRSFVIMNVDAVVFGILLAGLPVNRLTPGSRATVCLATLIPAADALTFERGELIASKVLQLAGLRLDWRDYGKPCPADRDPILLTVLSTTPKDYFPGAFGVSWPFEGVHTQVFLDRVMLLSSAGISSPVLGHAIAHEIAHMLSGTNAHSASGVMKVRWSRAELRDMAANPMRFTALDLLLLKNGLASRHQRLVNLRIRPQQQTVTMASE